jgi:hypothetical protein
MQSGNVVRCLRAESAIDPYGSSYEKTGLKDGAYYLVILNSNEKLKLFGVRGYFKKDLFELKHDVEYHSLPWFKKDYSKCGNWVLVDGMNWRFKYSSNTYGGPDYPKIKNALFVDPHSVERVCES